MCKIYVGQILYGFCGGHFSRDSYGDKVIEGIGKDWVVAREVLSKELVWAIGDGIQEELAQYLEEEEDSGGV